MHRRIDVMAHQTRAVQKGLMSLIVVQIFNPEVQQANTRKIQPHRSQLRACSVNPVTYGLDGIGKI
jgi:hypothetical protein